MKKKRLQVDAGFPATGKGGRKDVVLNPDISGAI